MTTTQARENKIRGSFRVAAPGWATTGLPVIQSAHLSTRPRARIRPAPDMSENRSLLRIGEY